MTPLAVARLIVRSPQTRGMIEWDKLVCFIVAPAARSIAKRYARRQRPRVIHGHSIFWMEIPDLPDADKPLLQAGKANFFIVASDATVRPRLVSIDLE